MPLQTSQPDELFHSESLILKLAKSEACRDLILSEFIIFHVKAAITNIARFAFEAELSCLAADLLDIWSVWVMYKEALKQNQVVTKSFYSNKFRF